MAVFSQYKVYLKEEGFEFSIILLWRCTMLIVNEVFGPTVQGEGKSAGMPCAFIRLSACNLWCQKCDTPHTWNWLGTKFSHPDKYDKKKEIHKLSVEEIWQQISSMGIQAVVISGGEPFIQQAALVPLLKKLKENGYWAEVETNGTFAPLPEFVALIDQINCSPKLDNEFGGNIPKARRLVPYALEQLSACGKANFKFVVCSEADAEQALELVKQFNMQDVALMPEARTKEELLAHSTLVKQLAVKYGFDFTTRLSIMLSGTKRGV